MKRVVAVLLTYCLTLVKIRPVGELRPYYEKNRKIINRSGVSGDLYCFFNLNPGPMKSFFSTGQKAVDNEMRFPNLDYLWHAQK